MKKIIVIIIFLFTISISFSQTTSLDGAWTAGSNWSGGTFPGVLTTNAGDDDLEFDNETILVTNRMTVGTSSSDRTDMTFINSNFSGSLTVDDMDTLIVYGDLDFQNKSMNLNIGDEAVLIVLGDATFANKMDVSTTGTLVVSGNFEKAGSQGSYTGGGAVYAGSYSGSADNFIPGDTGTGGDQQQTIDDLSDDDFEDIENFIEDVEDGGSDDPLPVELVDFSAKVESAIQLKWTTATEINNDYFVIERSEDGHSFYELGKVEGNGNSSDVINYSYKDNFPTSKVGFYRLKQVDFNGDFEYFSAIRVESNTVVRKSEVMIYPSIVSGQHFNMKSNTPFELKEIVLYNLKGGAVYQLTNNAEKVNPMNYRVNTSALEKGVYFLNMTSTTGKVTSTRLIIK